MLASITHEILCQCSMCLCNDDLLPLPRCGHYHRAVSQISKPSLSSSPAMVHCGGRGDLLYQTGPRGNSNWGILLSICCCCTRSHRNVNELSARGCLAGSLAFHFGPVVAVLPCRLAWECCQGGCLVPWKQLDAKQEQSQSETVTLLLCHILLTKQFVQAV